LPRRSAIYSVETEVNMALPLKFKKQVEQNLCDVAPPEHAWLEYAVCALDDDSCGWEGWMLGGVFKKAVDPHADPHESVLPNAPCFDCPNCGKALFRTFSARFDLAQDQTVPEIWANYDVLPVKYK